MKINIKSIIALGIFLFCIRPPISTYAASEYIGYDTQGGSTSTMLPSYCWGNKYNSDCYAATGGEIVDTFIIWCNPQNNNNKIVFGIYTIDGGIIRNKSAVSDTLTLSGSGVSRWVLPANYALSSERTYTICIDVIGSGGPAVCYTTQSSGLSRYNNSVFPDTWSDDQNNNMRYNVAAHFSIRKGGGSLIRRLSLGGEK